MSGDDVVTEELRWKVRHGWILSNADAQVLLAEIDRLRSANAENESRIVEYLKFCDVAGDVVNAIEDGIHLNDPATWGQE